jgi:spermidine synthase
MTIESPSRIALPTAAASWGQGVGNYLDMFLISFVILFFELACIRWFGSMVVFLTFFTNIVLMACFLGMTVGCLAASGARDYIRSVIPLALVAIALACGVQWAYRRGSFSVDVGRQESPQQVYFGTEPSATSMSGWLVPVEVVAGVFYVLIALMFVGLGQVMGRAFNAIPNRVAAYTTNIGGSLAGIVAFGVASYYHTTPHLWFTLAIGLILSFVRPWTPLQVFGPLALLFLVGWTSYSGGKDTSLLTWSPYYKVSYHPKTKIIDTNNIGHQQMVSLGPTGSAYLLPHLLNRDAGGEPFEDVLIIGAGSGNDVQAALAQGATRIDAVEIDPVLYKIGQADHPDRPYDDRRVRVHLDDGRSFVRKTDREYDLVVYALVDSLVLHSGYSSLRLESFLFTEGAFRDIKAKLKPGGIFMMYNYYRQGWVVGRLEKLAEKVFGSEPIVLSLPYQAKIRPTQSQAGSITVLLAGAADSPRLASIRTRLEGGESFWEHVSPRYNEAVNAYGTEPPKVAGTSAEHWNKIDLAEVDTTGIDRLPSDDWPFLYLRDPTIPGLNLRRSSRWRSSSTSRRCGRSGPTPTCSSWGPASCCWRPRRWSTWPCSSARPGSSTRSSSSRSW